MRLDIKESEPIPSFILAQQRFIVAYLGSNQQFCVLTRNHSLITSIHRIYIHSRFTPPTTTTLNILISGTLL